MTKVKICEVMARDSGQGPRAQYKYEFELIWNSIKTKNIWNLIKEVSDIKYQVSYDRSSGSSEACNFIKKETPAQPFFFESCNIFKNTLFIENPRWLLLL